MKRLLYSSIVLFLILGSASAQNFITIDGQKDAFYDNLTNPDDGKVFIPARAFITSIHAEPPAGGDADLSGIVWSCWDDAYLYYYAEVKDDFIYVNNATSSGSQWQNDKIELKFNPDPTIAGTGNVIQVGMTALDSADAQVPAAVDNMNQDTPDLQDTAGVSWYSVRTQPGGTWYEDFARRETDDGYVLEFRIPWQYMNKGTRRFPGPTAGVVFGAAINIADNDATQREDMIQWSAAVRDEAWNNATLHGSITLLADHKLKYQAVSPMDPTIFNANEIDWYFGGTVSIKPGPTAPEAFNLKQNYPNPFNPVTTIDFSLPVKSDVRLVLVNSLGQVVKEMARGPYSAGDHRIRLDASDLTTGVYFYRLEAGAFVSVKKLVVMK
jgi:hypothetical protein